MVVRPWQRLGAHFLGDFFGDLRAKTQVVDRVGKDMASCDRGIEIVVQVVYVHVAVAETPSGGDVEVPDDFVDAEGAFYAASFFALGVEAFGVVFALALGYVLAAAEGPG